MMKKTVLAAFLWGVVQPVVGGPDTSLSGEAETAWLAFANARGDASLIRGDANHPSANEVFRIIPVPGADSLDQEKLRLGAELFQEKQLSRDGSVACASCHVILVGGGDRQPVSFGIGGARGTMNAPTIFNAALNFRQFWDGRALTLQEQVLGPIQNPVEMGHDLDGVVLALMAIPDYVSAFDRIYPDGITTANLADAIAYYETMSYTGLESPFLRQFQEGSVALSSQARLGQQRFVEVGCASCHNGVNLGGNSFQALGVAQPWYGTERPASEADDGLFKHTGRERDRHVFKVPTLHNVASTGPWFHDGSATSLQQAVDRMARHQSGRYLENRDIDAIVAFLRALGDNLSLLGDCAVTGTYSVTLDCEVGRIDKSSVPRQEWRRTGLPEAGKLVEMHHQQYSAAQDKVTQAPMRIESEMQRIRSGAVVHYDFLQYEHIEMLRHARALSFPPADIKQAQRADLLRQAAEWQQSGAQYELMIADFLRQQAVISGARANLQDLLRILGVAADEQTRSLLVQVEQSVLKFYGERSAESQLSLENAVQALDNLNLEAQRLVELQLQVRLLLDTVKEQERTVL